MVFWFGDGVRDRKSSHQRQMSPSYPRRCRADFASSGMYEYSYRESPEWVASAPNRSGRSIGVIIAPNPPLDLPMIAR